MDADRVLEQIRHAVVTMRAEPVDLAMRHALAVQVVEQFDRLDMHLSGGGRPPAAWAEGPDAPELDDEALTTCPVGIPHTIQPIAPGVYGTPPTLMAGPDGPLDPLGGPIPGHNGSHLPEVSE